MIYRNLAIAALVSAAAACASTGGSTTDGTTTTVATTDTAVTATTGLTAATDSAVTTVDSASARSTTDMSAGAVGGDMAGAAQLDTVISVLDRGLTTVPAAEAVAAISSLQSYLSSATDPALSGMSSEFDALKTELQKPTVDNKAVGAVLSRIGPKATAAAQSAGPNSDRVSRLGTALTTAGTKLSGGM